MSAGLIIMKPSASSLPCLITVFMLVFGSCTFALNPPSSRKEADIRLIGKVQRVYESVQKDHIQHITELRVQEVKDGSAVKAGDVFYIWSFQWRDGAKKERIVTAHGPPPKVGQVVEAWVFSKGGANHGAKPRWFDVLPHK